MSVDLSNGAESLNFSNGRFAYLLNVLGFDPEENPLAFFGPLDSEEVAGKCQAVIRALDQGRGAEFIKEEERCGNVIDCGIDVDYIERRVSEIYNLAKNAKEGWLFVS